MKGPELSVKPRFSPLRIPVLVFLGAVGWKTMFSDVSGQSRTWTSTDGRKLVGEFVKAEGDAVTVRRENGRITSIPLVMLGEEDRKFVDGKKAEAKTGEAEAEDKDAKGRIRYKLSGGSEDWPEDRKKLIVDAMDAAVEFLNQHGDFKKEVTANNSPGTPTADANYDGWINWGGTINRRVALHEISHTLGIGTHWNWQKNIKEGKWTGKHGLEQLREFDGKDAVLYADRMHFWPYGLNFDNESSRQNDLRHVKMVAAMRKDMDIR